MLNEIVVILVVAGRDCLYVLLPDMSVEFWYACRHHFRIANPCVSSGVGISLAVPGLDGERWGNTKPGIPLKGQDTEETSGRWRREETKLNLPGVRKNQ